MNNKNKPEIECVYCGTQTEPLAIQEFDHASDDYICEECFGLPDQGPDWTDLPRLTPIDPD